MGEIFREDRRHAIAPLAVELVVAVEKNRLGAELRSGAQRHGGMHAEAARFVARAGYHAALVALAAYDYRLALQLRAREQFDGDEKRVHVHVQDRGRRFGRVRCLSIVLRAEVSQPRHGPQYSALPAAVRLRTLLPGRRFHEASRMNFIVGGPRYQRRGICRRLCRGVFSPNAGCAETRDDDQTRSAATTRGIPARSFVMRMLAQRRSASNILRTRSAES